MKIGILGTGMVGRIHATRLAELGHTVMLGTQDIEKTRANIKKDAMGNPPFAEWHKDHQDITLATFRDVAKDADIVFDALKGEVAVSVLSMLKSELASKILVDIANPLDFSQGMPPFLSVCNTDSLGEQIQKALPDTKVVKTFNTLNAYLQVNPAQLAKADHDLFICGNDADAKAKVAEIAKSYGWKNIIDLGDITTARGTEMLLPIWLRLWGALKTPLFNFKIVKE
ncbi:MAG: NADP oxidoreductase [Candidatus Ryanbacteria bacterium RIFCSPHIGHO2_02_FULL_45_43]|uniref:NADP oxidoreductase n=1 Tax=Candidatus Ryanbacteria bacterium RIFCSPHIGHO2_01_45_13 TaxID=1802112 RepID=A0A1G2FTG8_9BACT|nr:MAG: NADP oxidoreductase [Candidatus Ryanbacteria bacterium RIFCSPHIGHO2_01_45_13]OGZ41503.1 MAG: NADP oxidoreductase [Candidatus Ryanbacteria bacterium RIFCSPHIGHO2_01_FULL_44_130]OGZ47970.1 MAG: NADP oxidoreductase [Candidatus Ryanbacteria bacterium RIFCSPHIGHO2_02_FULL_45_43]OGZ50106.1 MAG: NADP oxidoreductase [Candidatus Ryanbacteria bacterium RIFCSPHIGHO2_12_FULL_44_20]OGZ51108.1 MAG: NADP oxidoreductase [Candidatus Ryanbacteria bacterium RIFCSPLOWO2_01_FULL_44_230]OGZ54395.1 MAG: NADP